jgi:hypothetical protein
MTVNDSGIRGLRAVSGEVSEVFLQDTDPMAKGSKKAAAAAQVLKPQGSSGHDQMEWFRVQQRPVQLYDVDHARKAGDAYKGSPGGRPKNLSGPTSPRW